MYGSKFLTHRSARRCWALPRHNLRLQAGRGAGTSLAMAALHASGKLALDLDRSDAPQECSPPLTSLPVPMHEHCRAAHERSRLLLEPDGNGALHQAIVYTGDSLCPALPRIASNLHKKLLRSTVCPTEALRFPEVLRRKKPLSDGFAQVVRKIAPSGEVGRLVESTV